MDAQITNEMLEMLCIQLDNAINESPEYEDQRKVREYRHELYPKWRKVHEAFSAKIRSLYAQLDARATVDAQRESYISDLQAELKADKKAREKLQVDLFDANHACQGALDCKEKAERKLAEVETVLRYIYDSTAEGGQWEESGVHNLVKTVLAKGE